MVFPLLRQSAGVMEWWSNGVMKRPIQVEIQAFAFANTPILQYSKAARNFSCRAIELWPDHKDLVLDDE